MSKIKLGELRINNWYESVKWKQAVMCEMSDIVQIYYIADGAKPDEDHIAMVFKPIPLTEDWLKRFGFEKIPNSQFVQFWNKQDITLWHRYDDEHNEFGLAYDKLDQVEFLYVHQLQNLYFALTGEELKIKDK